MHLRFLRHRTGFSLIELAIVLAISGVILGYVLKITDAASTKDCYVETKKQIDEARDAIERFANSRDRFPMPARRNVGIESPTYGREATAADLDVVGGAVFGALPFQALGMSVTGAADCWGNKLTYVVTLDLTDSTKFVVPGTNGTIDIKTNNTNMFLQGAGYAVISHGMDQLGAVKENYNAATNTLADRKWCAADAGGLRTQNCDVVNNVLISTAFNDGKDADANYFDDLIVYRGKPWRIKAAPGGDIYCWGLNHYGQLGGGASLPQSSVAHPTIPVDTSQMPAEAAKKFTKVSAGYVHTCAIASDGDAYCWGANGPNSWGFDASGQLGDGTTTDRNVPTKVLGGLKFKDISAGTRSTCGVTTTGEGYCWGFDEMGVLGNGDAYDTPKLQPTAVVGGYTFTSIRMGMGGTSNLAFGLTDDGKVYIWGVNWGWGMGGNGDVPTQTSAFSEAAGPYIDLSARNDGACVLSASGAVQCAGNGSHGHTGGNSPTVHNGTVASSAPVFAKLGEGGWGHCALTSDGTAYCWGTNSVSSSYYQQFEPCLTKQYCVYPGEVTVPTSLIGTYKWSKITSGGGHYCGLTLDGTAYCWGYAAHGQLGDNSSGPPPSGDKIWWEFRTVLGGHVFMDISAGQAHTCAITKP